MFSYRLVSIVYMKVQVVFLFYIAGVSGTFISAWLNIDYFYRLYLYAGQCIAQRTTQYFASSFLL